MGGLEMKLVEDMYFHWVDGESGWFLKGRRLQIDFLSVDAEGCDLDRGIRPLAAEKFSGAEVRLQEQRIFGPLGAQGDFRPLLLGGDGSF